VVVLTSVFCAARVGYVPDWRTLTLIPAPVAPIRAPMGLVPAVCPDATGTPVGTRAGDRSVPVRQSAIRAARPGTSKSRHLDNACASMASLKTEREPCEWQERHALALVCIVTRGRIAYQA